MKKVYPTPPKGNGEDVAEVSNTYSWKCLIQAANALSEDELKEVLRFEKQITFHNNAINGHESLGMPQTLIQFLESNGDAKLSRRIGLIKSNIEQEKKGEALQELEDILKLEELEKNHGYPIMGDGRDVAEFQRTFLRSLVLEAGLLLSDEDLRIVLKHDVKINFHSNCQGRYGGSGASWTIKEYFEYDGDKAFKARIKLALKELKT